MYYLPACVISVQHGQLDRLSCVQTVTAGCVKGLRLLSEIQDGYSEPLQEFPSLNLCSGVERS